MFGVLGGRLLTYWMLYHVFPTPKDVWDGKEDLVMEKDDWETGRNVLNLAPLQHRHHRHLDASKRRMNERNLCAPFSRFREEQHLEPD